MQTFNQSLATLHFRIQITLELAPFDVVEPGRAQDMINRARVSLNASVAATAGGRRPVGGSVAQDRDEEESPMPNYS